MTRRERQLLEWIRENPCISQQELADKAGITRSSAAVHISNLMRKGYIAGRGYLLREAPYIAVVGGVNMDIGAVSDAPLVARDSNPGRVTTMMRLSTLASMAFQSTFSRFQSLSTFLPKRIDMAETSSLLVTTSTLSLVCSTVSA